MKLRHCPRLCGRWLTHGERRARACSWCHTHCRRCGVGHDGLVGASRQYCDRCKAALNTGQMRHRYRNDDGYRERQLVAHRERYAAQQITGKAVSA